MEIIARLRIYWHEDVLKYKLSWKGLWAQGTYADTSLGKRLELLGEGWLLRRRIKS